MPLGVIVNSSVVLLGGLTGGVLGRKIPRDVADHLPAAFGLVAMSIGINLIVKVANLTPVALAIILGTLFGELGGMEDRLKKQVHRLVEKTKDRDPERTETLIVVILLFCFSGMGIFGALNEGFTGDPSVLITKSILDFFTAVIFGASAGYLVALVSLPQVLIGLALFRSAGYVVPLLSPSMLSDFRAAGGIITLAAGFKVAGIKSMRAINMLPSLLLVLIFSALWSRFIA
jgi:uncharacterized membrane protein YqgA involved in biofilm formation